MEKQLSIIIPIYKVEKYIRPCIESVIQQGLEEDHYEIILVDDGTPDRSMEQVADIIDSHTNVRVVHQENQGLSAARNSGMAIATGEYILFLDSDDMLVDGSLLPLLEKAMETKADMVIAHYLEKPGEIASLQIPPQKDMEWREKTGKELFVEKLITPMVWDKLYRLAFLKNNHLQFISGINCEDVPFTYYCYFKAGKCLDSNILLYLYRRRDDSITGKYSLEFAHDTSVAIGKIWELRQQAGITPEVYNRLERNCFFYFYKVIHCTLKYITGWTNQFRVMHYLTTNAPDLCFTDGKYQKWITLLYRYSPRLLMAYWILRSKWAKK